MIRTDREKEIRISPLGRRFQSAFSFATIRSSAQGAHRCTVIAPFSALPEGQKSRIFESFENEIPPTSEVSKTKCIY